MPPHVHLELALRHQPRRAHRTRELSHVIVSQHMDLIVALMPESLVTDAAVPLKLLQRPVALLVLRQRVQRRAQLAALVAHVVDALASRPQIGVDALVVILHQVRLFERFAAALVRTRCRLVWAVLRAQVDQ